jgi:hypothetical protein
MSVRRQPGSAKQGLPHWIDSASLRPAGSFYSHLHTDRVRDSRNNGILHLQEVEPVLVELVSPEMRISVSMS